MQSQLLDMQARSISRHARINRRVRKHRMEKIQRDQSFNKQDILNAFYLKKTS